MEEFGFYKHEDLPPDGLNAIRRAKEEATREIADFTVSFVSRQRVLGSGTLVTTHGHSGVLTAFHVAEELKNRGEKFGMIISEEIRQYLWEMDWVEIVPVGTPSDPMRPDLGPDLAFIRLLEPQKLGTLRSKKSFYRLDGRSFDTWEKYPLKEMSWWIAGSPAEFSTSAGEPNTAQHILSASHFLAEAAFQSKTDRGQFDFVDLEVFAGAESFPADYGGVSGGGIWLVPLRFERDEDPSTIVREPSFLTGTAFYQGPEDDQKRNIVGHGPTSLYTVVPSALAQRGFVRQQ